MPADSSTADPQSRVGSDDPAVSAASLAAGNDSPVEDAMESLLTEATLERIVMK
eukprot:gene24954-10612_t